MTRTLLRALVLVSLIWCGLPQQGAQASAESTPAIFVVNPVTLRERILEGNLALVEELNKVKDAKDMISVARGNLLPSLNLGGMLTSAHSFALSSVQFLLPFLMPSNWFDYKASKAAFEAEKLSFQILRLNTYSSSLSAYMMVLSDKETQKVYEDEYSDLKKIYDILSHGVALGTSSPSDLLPLQAQMQMAGVQSSVLAQLGKQEIAALRAALALPLTTQLDMEETEISPSTWETQEIQTVVNQANAVAPEHLQIQYLVKVAKDRKWSTVFGFINGTTMASQVSPGASGNASFTDMSTKGQVSLGFALYPQIKISNRNIEEVKLMDAELIQSNAQILESSMKSLQEAKTQFDLASSAEDALKKTYKIKSAQYNLGVATLTDLLFARIQTADASIAKLRARLALNLQRTVIHRALLTDQFAFIGGCKSANLKAAKHASLDQLCRQPAN